MLKLALPKPEKHCDPESLAAKCEECPLYDQHRKRHLAVPVPGENVRPARLAILAEAPGNREEELGRPLVGASGYFLNYAFKEVGLKRQDVALLNTLLCKPPKKFSQAEWIAAEKACLPRLKRELEVVQPSVVFAAGARALEVLTGLNKITEWYGSPLPSRLGAFKVFPSYHPAFALRTPAMYPVFTRWLDTAKRLSTGELQDFQWGELVATEDEGKIYEALRRLHEAAAQNQFIAIDIENNPTTGNIRCVGLATSRLAVSVPFDTPPSEGVVRLFAEIVSSSCPKVFHNAQFDILELKRWGLKVGGEIHDTLLAHAVVAPRLRHRLTDVAAFETHAERWKTKFGDLKDDKFNLAEHFASVGLADLQLYNAKDAQMTAILWDLLWPQVVKEYRGTEQYETLRKLDNLAMRMREAGIQVDVTKFEGHKKGLGEVLDATRAEFQKLGFPENVTLGEAGGSKSLNRLFFDTFEVQPFSYSEKTGAPSLDAKTLQRVATSTETKDSLPGITARVILKYRKHAKLLSSYVIKLKDQIDANAVAHPVWRPWGTRTGRWSATDPALQTIPKPKIEKQPNGEVIQIAPGMRDLFCAKPGMWLVSADYSQLELRILGLLAGDELLLRWYEQGEDVHLKNAESIYKEKWQKMSGKEQKAARELAKRVVYGLNYGGGAETIWRSLLVDSPSLPLGHVQRVIDGWYAAHPAIKAWQDAQIEKANRLLYVEAPISGRRQYYHDGKVVPTEALNFPIQASAGDRTNLAALAIDADLDWSCESLAAQVHDDIMVHGPDWQRLARLLKHHMEAPLELNGLSIVLPVDLKRGQSWGHMEKVEL